MYPLTLDTLEKFSKFHHHQLLCWSLVVSQNGVSGFEEASNHVCSNLFSFHRHVEESPQARLFPQKRQDLK